MPRNGPEPLARRRTYAREDLWSYAMTNPRRTNRPSRTFPKPMRTTRGWTVFFSELSIENVGVYRGRQTLDLRTEKTRPVILIGGMNGCGKTTLLDSLHMALYGRRARLS